MTSILDWASKDGSFNRQTSSFRDKISKCSTKFQPEPNRYHLYISLACPWAHRTLIVRNLKGLQSIIGISIVDYLLGPEGWKFSPSDECPGAIPDTLYNSKYLRELYYKAEPSYSARFTVPVLWDRKTQTIVNNESSEIIRMLNSEFNEFADNPQLDLYPERLRQEIDQTNQWVYQMINNGVYKAGFATTQQEYEENARKVYQGIVKVEEILSKQAYIIPGEQLTEADVRLYTSIVRFDPVYFGHFKCNLIAIKDCPNILRWLCMISRLPTIKETINMTHIKNHYYMSHIEINPTRVVPLSNGPDLWEQKDKREE